MRKKDNFYGYIFIAPWLVGFLILQLGPMLMSFFYSFTDYDYFKEINFIGLQNYIELFHDQVFLNTVSVSFKYVASYVPLRLIFALIIAVLLSQAIKGISFYRVVYYMPSILGGGVAVSIMWKILLSNNGAVNQLLAFFHIDGPNWLTNPDYALFSIVIMTCWAFGSAMIIFLAALKGVPKELYEAASVDGASSVRQFFTITIPYISPVIFFNTIMSLITGFKVFTQPFIMTEGGPVNATTTFVIYLYNSAFKYFRMGYSSAIAWIMFFIIMAFTLLIFKSSSFWVYYQSTKR